MHEKKGSGLIIQLTAKSSLISKVPSLSLPAKLPLRKNQMEGAAVRISDYGKFYSKTDSWNAMAQYTD